MRTRHQAKLALRTALAATAALALLVAGMGNAFGDPARASSAHAFGLQATGILAVPKTPEVTVAAPPDNNDSKRVVLPLGVGTLAINATLTAEGQAHFASDIQPRLAANPAPPPAPNNRNVDAVQRDNNTRAFAETEGLRVLATVADVASAALVEVDVVMAEAVARCVGGTPQFDTGFRVGDVKVASLPLSLDSLLSPVLNLLGPTGPLSSIVQVIRNEVIDLPDGIAVNALRLKVLPAAGGSALEDIIVSHAEVHMPTPCNPSAPPASPAARLARTGGGGLSSMLGASLIMGAVLMIVFVRKWRLSE